MNDKTYRMLANYPQLRIFPDGRVYDTRWMRWRKLSNSNGYKMISVANQAVYVHRLVAEAFVDNPLGKKCVNHIDHDRSNNSIGNLEWCTHSENRQWDYISGRQTGVRGSINNWAKVTEADVSEIRGMYKAGMLQRVIAKKFNLTQSGVSDITRRRRWSHV